MKTLLFSIALFASSLASSQAFGQMHSQAWFVHEANDYDSSFMHICAIAPTAAEAHEIVWQAHSAHLAWVAYYNRNSLHHPKNPAEPGFRINGRVNENCDGTEDLTIYYGVENDRVRAARTSYDNPAAFAHLESYNEQTGQGRGFIWIDHSPEISFHPRHRFAILLHEMGHAFGIDHIPGTIMDENIAKFLRDAYLSGKPFTPNGPKLTNGEPVAEAWIELQREAEAWDVIRIPKQTGTVEAGSLLDRVLTLLTGEHIQGAYDLRFYDKWGWKDETDDYTDTGKGMFVVQGNSCINPRVLLDGVWRAPCVWQFKVVYGAIAQLPAGEQQLFRRVYRGQEFSRPLLSSMQTGYFLDSRGKKTDFVISRNVGEKLDLSIVVGGEKIRVY